MDERATELARQIKIIADAPAEVGSAHAAAQGALAAMAVELADLVLEENS